MSDFVKQIDVRKIRPQEKHPSIFRTFEELRAGEKMELINDHDPRPLHYQFMMELPEQFGWEYLEEGPDVWRVAIEKKVVH